MLCAAPKTVEGYEVDEADLVAQSFRVAASCQRGYEGRAKATPCGVAGESYVLSGCKYSTAACVAPADSTGYLVTEVELRKLVFSVQAQCAPGYQGLAKATACAHDLGVYGLSGCTPRPICKAPKQQEGYVVTEQSLSMAGFQVQVACAASHVGTPKATVCAGPLKAYELSGCERKVYCVAPKTEGYEVTELDLVAQRFQVAASCAPGYEGTPQVEACVREGEAYVLRGGSTWLGRRDFTWFCIRCSSVLKPFHMVFAWFSGGAAPVSGRACRLQVQHHDVCGAGQHAGLCGYRAGVEEGDLQGGPRDLA